VSKLRFLLLFYYFSKNPTPQQLALLSALNTAILLLFLLLGIKLFAPADWLSWWLVLLLPLFNLLTSYLSMFEALRRFIYRKIKLIYKAIHTLKAPKTADPLQVDMRNHVIDQVEREVVVWAVDWTQEIKYLKKAEIFRKEFISNVSHELKTPIFNIQGYLYTLLDDEDGDVEIQKKYLQRAVDNVERMANIVADLNEIARLENGQIKLDISRFDICQLAHSVMDDLEMLAAQHQIRLEFKEEIRQPSWVLADSQRIHQVLTNLISNSIKYGKEKGKTLIAFYDWEGLLWVEISDNGKGIEEEHLPRVFERFYRTDKARARHEGGSGLGLAIVKHIIEAHNQTVHVRSRINVGTTFAFTLQKDKS
jgi:two-component system phosphate regulon sensor histidine kinase PhoR